MWWVGIDRRKEVSNSTVVVMPILWMLLVLLPTTVYCICNAKKRAAQYPADAHRTLSKAGELTARAVEEVFPLLPDVWKVDGVEKNDANYKGGA